MCSQQPLDETLPGIGFCRMSNRIVVHKFGGTSLANAKCFERCRDIIVDACGGGRIGVCVVVSAIGGKPKVTDLLLQAVTCARQGQKQRFHNLLDQLMKKHQSEHHQLGTFLARDVPREY